MKSAAAQNEQYQQLVDAINELLNRDFEKLVQLLYTVDVSEKKLKAELKEHPEKDAARLIADLLLERQAQKKKNLPQKPEDIPDEERW